MKFPENLIDFALDRLGNVSAITFAFHSVLKSCRLVQVSCYCKKTILCSSLKINCLTLWNFSLYDMMNRPYMKLF